MTAKKRILMVSTSYPVTPEGASGIFVKRLVDALAAKGHKLTALVPAPFEAGVLDDEVVLFRYAPTPFQKLAHTSGGIPAGLRRSRWNILWAISLALNLAIRLARLARRHDLVIANWAMTGYLATLTRFVHRKPVITVLRGSDINTEIPRRSRVLDGMVRGSREVVCVSQQIQQVMQGLYPDYRAKFSFIPNGVAETFYQLEPKSAGDDIELVAIGNLTRNKNLSTILQALSIVNKSSLRCRLSIVGEGDQKADLLRRVTELNLSDRVHFEGRVNPTQIPGILARSDIFVHGSFSEGRSNAVLEAMAASRVVIASNIPANQELIEAGVSGFLFDPESPQELAHVLAQLSDPRLRQSIGAAARQRLEEMGLKWDSCANRYDEVIGRVA